MQTHFLLAKGLKGEEKFFIEKQWMVRSGNWNAKIKIINSLLLFPMWALQFPNSPTVFINTMVVFFQSIRNTNIKFKNKSPSHIGWGLVITLSTPAFFLYSLPVRRYSWLLLHTLKHHFSLSLSSPYLYANTFTWILLFLPHFDLDSSPGMPITVSVMV